MLLVVLTIIVTLRCRQTEQQTHIVILRYIGVMGINAVHLQNIGSSVQFESCTFPLQDHC